MIQFASVYELILKFEGDFVDYMSSRRFSLSKEDPNVNANIGNYMRVKEYYKKCDIACTISFSRRTHCDYRVF